MATSEALAISEDIRAVFLTSEDLKVAASILYQAYHDDPLFMSMFQMHKEGYEQRVRSAIREELNAFWLAKQTMIGLFEGERMLAVLCLTHSDSAFGPGRFWHWRVKMLLTAGMFSTNQILEKEQKIRENITAEHYHVISFIAVHPDEQHHGLGSLLVAAIESVLLDSINSEGVAVFATLPKYKQFFERSGYGLLKTLQIGEVDGHLMFRAKE